jgi:AcrR family transcriptional regulator
VPPAPSKERLLEAAYRCVARYGLAKTTIDDVAREARVSRPTMYRQFPGGKDALLREVVGWEAARFIDEITTAVAAMTDLEALLEELIVVAYRAIAKHDVLQKVLQTEPERLLPMLVTGADRLIALMKPLLLAAMKRSSDGADHDHDVAAEYIARMVLSVVSAPAGRDLEDRRVVRDFVRVELLGGIT